MPVVQLADSEDRKETLASAVYDRLRQAIITVSIAPGEKLNIRALCDRFDVGLSPMREALSRLSTEGLVQQFDHRGFAVTPLSEEDLIDLTQARASLNELAIRNSVTQGDAAWEENVVLCFHRLSRTPRFEADSGDTRSAQWELAHRKFHSSLIAASGSKRIEQYCEHLFDGSERYRHVGRMAGIKGENRDGEHKALMEAAVARDADAAATLVKAHFEHTAELVRKVLRDRAL